MHTLAGLLLSVLVLLGRTEAANTCDSGSFTDTGHTMAALSITSAGNPCSVSISNDVITGSLSLPIASSLTVTVVNSTIGSVTWGAGCSGTTLSLINSTVGGFTVTGTFAACSLSITNNSFIGKMTVSSSWTTNSVMVVSNSQWTSGLALSGATGGQINVTDCWIDTDVLVGTSAGVSVLAIQVLRTKKICSTCIASSTSALIQCSTASASFSYITIQDVVFIDTNSGTVALLTTSGTLTSTNVLISRISFTSTSAGKLIAVAGALSSCSIAIYDSVVSNSIVFYMPNGLTSVTLSARNVSTTAALGSIAAVVTQSTITLDQCTCTLPAVAGNFFFKISNGVTLTDFIVTSSQFYATAGISGVSYGFNLGSAFGSSGNSIVMVGNVFNCSTTDATFSGVIGLTQTNLNRIAFEWNTVFLLSGATGTAYGVLLSGTIVANQFLFNTNTIQVNSASGSPVGLWLADTRDVGRFEFRYNTIRCAGSMNVYGFGVGKITSNVSFIGIENNTFSIQGGTDVRAFKFVGAAPSPWLLSFRNNSATVLSTAAGAASAVYFTAAQTATFTFDFSSNVVVTSAGCAPISFVASSATTSLLVAENDLYVARWNASTAYGGINIRARCNTEDGVKTQNNVFATLGAGTASVDPCGTCVQLLDCSTGVTSGVSSISSMCFCSCSSGGTVASNVPKEDQCVSDVPALYPAPTLKPVVSAAATPVASTTTTSAVTGTSTAATVFFISSDPPTSTIPITTLPVSPGNVTINVTLNTTTAAAAPFSTTVPSDNTTIFTVAPTNVPEVATQATQGGVGIAVVGSGASGGSAGWSNHAARAALLASLIQCPNPIDPNEDLEPLENPLGISIGGRATQQYLGAVVGDLALIAAVVTLQVLVAFLIKLVSETSFKDACVYVRLPRADYIWWMLLLQPLMRCSLVLASNSQNSPSDFVIGASVFTVCLIAVAFMTFRVTTAANETVYVAEVEDERAQNATGAALRQGCSWIFEEQGEWAIAPLLGEEKDVAEFNHLLYKPLYAPYQLRGRYFMIVELISAVAFAVVGAIIPSDNDECIEQAAAAVICTVVYFLLVVAVRPCDVFIDNVVLFLLSLLEMASASLILWFTTDQNQRSWARDASQWTSTAAMWLVILVTVKDCIGAIVRVSRRYCGSPHHEGDRRTNEPIITALDDGGENPIHNPVRSRQDEAEVVILPSATIGVPFGTMSYDDALERIEAARAASDEEWIDDAELNMVYLPSLDVYYDGASGHFFDGAVGQWYDPGTGEWYTA